MPDQMNDTPTFSNVSFSAGMSDNVSFATMKILIEPASLDEDRPKPSAKALRAMKRLAEENRTPQRWLDGNDDPTVAD
mgnify:CR=1 FL=1